jgi:hypothetical protein
MAVAPTPVAAAPDAPDRAQRATFSARATAFFDWIKNTFVAGVNALASVTYSNAIEAATQATAAAASNKKNQRKRKCHINLSNSSITQNAGLLGNQHPSTI